MNKNVFLLLCVAMTTPAITLCQNNTKDCIDQNSMCSKYASSCIYEIMQSACPITCNSCPTNPCNQSNKGGCSDICEWSDETKVTCKCRKGFKLDTNNKTCVDINECTEGPNPCPSNPFLTHFCYNLPGSFACIPSSQCQGQDPTTSNYYKSSKCCKLPNNSTCGSNVDIRARVDPGIPQPRISGGSRSKPFSWPWMVEIVGRGGVHLCGGTLISRSFVLSAKRCFNESDANNDKRLFFGHVTFGSSTIVERKIKKVITHDTADLAVIELNQPLEFDDVISPVCLPCGELPKLGEKCFAIGFGVTELYQLAGAPPVLREVDVPIVGINKCLKTYNSSNPGHPVDRINNICAGYEQGGKDACLGDGGGPLLCQRKDSCSWYVTGVTSLGRGCGEAGFYGVYVNVLMFERWIKEQIGAENGELCTANFDPCDGLQNQVSGCRDNPDACAPRHKENCSRSCCERKHGRVFPCFDKPGFGAGCQVFERACNVPLMRTYMKNNCQKTCGFC